MATDVAVSSSKNYPSYKPEGKGIPKFLQVAITSHEDYHNNRLAEVARRNQEGIDPIPPAEVKMWRREKQHGKNRKDWLPKIYTTTATTDHPQDIAFAGAGLAVKLIEQGLANSNAAIRGNRQATVQIVNGMQGGGGGQLPGMMPNQNGGAQVIYINPSGMAVQQQQQQQQGQPLNLQATAQVLGKRPRLDTPIISSPVVQQQVNNSSNSSGGSSQQK